MVSAWLVNLVGLSSALDLLWRNRSLDAVKAHRMGLVNRLVLQGEEAAEDAGEGRLPMIPMQSSITTAEGTALSGGIKLARELLLYAPVT